MILAFIYVIHSRVIIYNLLLNHWFSLWNPFNYEENGIQLRDAMA